MSGCWRSRQSDAVRIVSPATTPGSTRARCESEPKCAIGSAPSKSVGHSGTGATAAPCASSSRHTSMSPKPAPPSASGTARPRRSASARARHRSRSTRSSLTSTAAMRSGSAIPAKIAAAASDTASCSSVSLKSIRHHRRTRRPTRRVPARTPATTGSSSKSTNSARSAIPISMASLGTSARFATRRVPSSSSIKPIGQRILERGHLRIVHDHVRVERAAARGLHGVPLQRPARTRTRAAAGGARCRTTCTAGSAAVRLRPLEPERVVLGERRSWPRRTRRRAIGWQVLEDTEAHRGHGVAGVEERLDHVGCHLVIGRHVRVGNGDIVDAAWSGSARCRARSAWDRRSTRSTERTSTRSPTTSGRHVVLLAVRGDDRGESLVIEQTHHHARWDPLPCSAPAARASSTSRDARRPRMIHAWSMVGGAMSSS